MGYGAGAHHNIDTMEFFGYFLGCAPTPFQTRDRITSGILFKNLFNG
jgi:hypothetical protein